MGKDLTHEGLEMKTYNSQGEVELKVEIEGKCKDILDLWLKAIEELVFIDKKIDCAEDNDIYFSFLMDVLTSVTDAYGYEEGAYEFIDKNEVSNDGESEITKVTHKGKLIVLEELMNRYKEYNK